MKNRFFVDHALTKGSRISLSKDEIKHFKVTRIKPDEVIEMINGKGVLAKATFNGKDQVLINEFEQAEKQKQRNVLFQAIAEGGHLDFIIEKGVELGVTDFVLFAAKKSKIQKLSENRIARLEKLAIGAMKQSKRLYLPKIEIVKDLSDYNEPLDHLFIADPSGENLNMTPAGDCGMIVGPESGLTQDEIEAFVLKHKAKKVALSDNILRCETAAMISAFLLARK